MQRIKWSLPVIATALLAQSLGGCVAGDTVILPTLTEQTVVAPQQGVVVARFINAGNYPLPFNQLTIAPQNLNQSDAVKLERLISVTKQLDGNAVFASPVNTGSYALNSIRSFHTRGEYSFTRDIGADATFGTFQVQPGKVTDLGTIVFYPKPAGDSFEDILVRVPDTASGNTLDAHLAFRDYDKRALLTWDDDGFDDDRTGLFLSVLQNPVTYERAYETPDGAVLFLAPLGVILERDASGNWSADAVETNLQMFAVAQNEAGDRAVGGSEGRVFFRPAGGAWVDVSLDADQHVDSLEFAPDGRLVALIREESATVIKAWTGGSAWTDLNQLVATRGWYAEAQASSFVARLPTTPQRIAGAVFSDFEDKSYVELSVHKLNRDRVFPSTKTLTYEYDPSTYVMTRINAPKDVLYQADAGSQTIALKRPGFFSLTGTPTYFRQDASEGWIQMADFVRYCGDTPTVSLKCGSRNDGPASLRRQIEFFGVPWFRNENDGIAVGSVGSTRGIFTSGAPQTKMLTTTDGGTSWLISENEPPTPYCLNLVSQIDDRILVSCRGTSGDFYESFDDGASWVQVREHQNF